MSDPLWSDERLRLIAFNVATIYLMDKSAGKATPMTQLIEAAMIELRDDMQAGLTALENDNDRLRQQVTQLEANADPDALTAAYLRGVSDERERGRKRIAELEAQLAAMRERVAADHYAMSQAIGESLDYPVEEYGVEAGEQVLISLVDELAERHAQALAQLAAASQWQPVGEKFILTHDTGLIGMPKQFVRWNADDQSILVGTDDGNFHHCPLPDDIRLFRRTPAAGE